MYLLLYIMLPIQKTVLTMVQSLSFFFSLCVIIIRTCVKSSNYCYRDQTKAHPCVSSLSYILSPWIIFILMFPWNISKYSNVGMQYRMLLIKLVWIRNKIYCSFFQTFKLLSLTGILELLCQNPSYCCWAPIRAYHRALSFSHQQQQCHGKLSGVQFRVHLRGWAGQARCTMV